MKGLLALFAFFSHFESEAQRYLPYPGTFLVATGTLRTISQAREYCRALNRQLPSPDQAMNIYSLTRRSDGTTSLVNFDNNVTPGSFWTRGTSSTLGCPLLLAIHTGKARIEKSCKSRTKLLTVCVP